MCLNVHEYTSGLFKTTYMYEYFTKIRIFGFFFLRIVLIQ